MIRSRRLSNDPGLYVSDNRVLDSSDKTEVNPVKIHRLQVISGLAPCPARAVSGRDVINIESRCTRRNGEQEAIFLHLVKTCVRLSDDQRVRSNFAPWLKICLGPFDLTGTRRRSGTSCDRLGNMISEDDCATRSASKVI